MAQDYVVVKNTGVNNGRIAINKSVFQAISEITIKDIENVKAAEGKFAKPVTLKIDDNKLMIEADIKVAYGANVNATCGLVQSKIYENIVFMTGYKPAEITVNVIGFDI
ncbi:MAG: Asp23/Gls24 family envelope stress response protein [Solobacterium sp.]|nr:Asp23/Gls24 family envelope stress response protein [Solobacterium sp.]